MPVAKLRANVTPDAMKSEEGSDSLDTFISQAVGKEPLLSFSRTGDSSVQWIQLLNALDQQDLPGWPLLTHLKVQMQKCDKCAWEFCSPINYRRHIRVHRRSLKVDKDSHKNKDLLGAFWDKLSLDEAKEIVSFKDVTLEEVSGSSIIRALAAFIRKPGFCALPLVYVRAGSALLDIIQGKLSGLPVSSQELFSILDDASERTFLCAGAAESMQKYVFDGDAGKNGLEMKNLVACTSFLVERKLVKAWLADKDAEALRCQKLLVEEEEAAQKRQAELLERRRQKKLRHKEQKAKDQSNGEKADLNVTADRLESPPSGSNGEKADLNVTADRLESPPSAETSSPSAPSEGNSHALDTLTAHAPSHLELVQFLNSEEDADIEAEDEFNSEHSDSSTGPCVEAQNVHENDRRHLVITRWQLPKPQKAGRNGFHASQNLHILKSESMHNHAPHRDPRVAPVNGSKVWTKKPKAENVGDYVRTRVRKEAINQTDQINCELMIGSISVAVRNCTVQQQVNSQVEAQDNCSTEHTMLKKNNAQEKLIKPDSVQCGTNSSSVKFWRPVSRHEMRVQLPVQSGNQELEDDVISGKGDDNRTVPGESCLQSCGMDRNDCQSGNSSNSPLIESPQPEGMLFSSRAAKAFLAQRWKEAITGDHVKLVLSSEPESPGYPDVQNDRGLAASASDFQERSILGNAENRLANVGAFESSTTGNGKAKFKTKPEKGVKIKYIPKQRAVI